MKRTIHVIVIMSLFISCGENPAVPAIDKYRSFIDESKRLIKGNALFADSINWTGLDAALDKIEYSDNDSLTVSLIAKSFTKAFREAGDRHSFFLDNKVLANYFRENVPAKPEAWSLGNGLACIKVPAFMGEDAAQVADFANTIRNEIRRIDSSETVTGWVVDLRGNTGGNMWPMLAGLNALLDDGTVGYFLHPGKKTPWTIRNGHIPHHRIKISSFKTKNLTNKIAVLIDSKTASSGEMTAISFAGLSNAKLIGAPSAGLTTANVFMPLPNDYRLALAVSNAADRTGKIYKGKIIPDELIDQTVSTPGQDGALDAAKKWVLSQ